MKQTACVIIGLACIRHKPNMKEEQLYYFLCRLMFSLRLAENVTVSNFIFLHDLVTQ